jgi:hypothetical protein
MVYQSQGIGLLGTNDINSKCYKCFFVCPYLKWTLYRWVVLYNANLDRSPNNRKTIVELKKDLKRWEEERPKKKKPVVSDVLGYQVLKTSQLLSSDLFCYNNGILSDSSQDRVLPTGQRCEGDDKRKDDDANIY